MYNTFSSVFDSEHRGTFFNDISRFDIATEFTLSNRTTYTRIPSHIQSFFSSRFNQARPMQVLMQQSIARLGSTFSPSRISPGNSNIIVGSTTDWNVCRILEIFSFQSEGSFDVYLVVERYAPLTPREAKVDPYRRYPHAGSLVHSKVQDTLIVKATDVLCHCATTPVVVPGVGETSLHVLPLIRVRMILWFTYRSLIDQSTQQ